MVFQIGVNIQVISYEEPKTTKITETCQISFGSIMANTVALRDLIEILPDDLKTQVEESVKFEENCGLY